MFTDLDNTDGKEQTSRDQMYSHLSHDSRGDIKGTSMYISDNFAFLKVQ